MHQTCRQRRMLLWHSLSRHRTSETTPLHALPTIKTPFPHFLVPALPLRLALKIHFSLCCSHLHIQTKTRLSAPRLLAGQDIGVDGRRNQLRWAREWGRGGRRRQAPRCALGRQRRGCGPVDGGLLSHGGARFNLIPVRCSMLRDLATAVRRTRGRPTRWAT